MNTLDPVLNELSLTPPAPSVYAARTAVDTLIRTVIDASKHGASKTIRSHIDLNELTLADSYTVKQWRNDREVDQVLRSLFRSFATKAPYLADLPEKSQAAEEVDCFCNDCPAVGLRAAYVIDSLALSLPLNEHWNEAEITILIRELDEETAELRDTACIVRHASSREHTKVHQDWIKRRTQVEITSGETLWEQRGQRFPSLSFCSSVQGQLAEILDGDVKLPQVLRVLDALEAYAAQWREGRFDADRLRGTPSTESTQTLQRYGRERTFRCPDGQERLFSWHQKLYGCNWRIYFHPDDDQKHITVGYIGPHLPTILYPT